MELDAEKGLSMSLDAIIGERKTSSRPASRPASRPGQGASRGRGQRQAAAAPYRKSREGLNTQARGGGGGGNRVFVGNLSWDCTWQLLKDHMRNAGEVVHAKVLEGQDGRSKGAGLVEYATAREARNAINTLTDTSLKGRLIFCREDREAGSGPHGQSPGGGGGAGVYVGNLSWDVSWQVLKDHMRTVGNVIRADVMLEPDGKSKGCGLVVYATPAEARRAINTLTDTNLNGRPIFVREDREVGNKGVARRADGGRGQTFGNQAQSALGRQVYVGNLAYSSTWQTVKDHLRTCGDVQYVEIPEDGKGRSAGYAIVRFAEASAADQAIATLNDTELNGRLIFVREDREAK